MAFKPALLRFLNPVLFLLAAFQVGSGIFMQDYFQLFGLHRKNGYILGLAILLHIILNWSWIKYNYLKPKKKD